MLQEDIEEIELALGESKILTSWIPAWVRIKKKLKELAQQTTNSAMPKCPKCGGNSEVVDAFRCFACNEWFEEGTSA